MDEQSKQIVVVGSINTDLVALVGSLPGRGETIAGRSFAIYQGGKGANQAVAAARLGASVRLIGMVGDDTFGKESLRQLRLAGVGCEHVETCSGSSGIAAITVGLDGQNSIVVVPGANAGLSPSFLEDKRSVIRSAGLVLSQLEIPLETVVRLAEICEEEGVPLMLDPAPAQDLPAGLLRRCTWLTPNETETVFYTGEPLGMPETQVAKLRTMGANNVILKRGERGAYLDCVAAAPLAVAALRVPVVDTTAAGDTYNAAFATALMRNESFAACAKFAGAAAAVTVTRPGAQASMPTLAEVHDLLQREKI